MNKWIDELRNEWLNERMKTWISHCRTSKTNFTLNREQGWLCYHCALTGVLTEKREDFKEEPNKEPIKEPTEEPIKEPNEEPIKEPTDKPADQQALTRAELQDELGMLFNGITKRMNDEFYYLFNQLGLRLDILKKDLEKIIKEEKIIGGKEGVVKK